MPKNNVIIWSLYEVFVMLPLSPLINLRMLQTTCDELSINVIHARMAGLVIYRLVMIC
jgi:hypothetical protein